MGSLVPVGYSVRIHGTAAWRACGQLQEHAEFVHRKSRSFRLNNTMCLTISLVQMGAGKLATTMVWTLPPASLYSVAGSQPRLNRHDHKSYEAISMLAQGGFNGA
jgi:hypothetical protein